MNGKRVPIRHFGKLFRTGYRIGACRHAAGNCIPLFVFQFHRISGISDWRLPR